MVFAEVLRSDRKDAGLSQVGLSALIDVPQTTISKVERAHREVTILEFLALCEALSVAPTDVLARLYEQASRQGIKRPGRR